MVKHFLAPSCVEFTDFDKCFCQFFRPLIKDKFDDYNTGKYKRQTLLSVLRSISLSVVFTHPFVPFRGETYTGLNRQCSTLRNYVSSPADIYRARIFPSICYRRSRDIIPNKNTEKPTDLQNSKPNYRQVADSVA